MEAWLQGHLGHIYTALFKLCYMLVSSHTFKVESSQCALFFAHQHANQIFRFVTEASQPIYEDILICQNPAGPTGGVALPSANPL